MSDPLSRQSQTEEDGLKASTNVPPDPPPTFYMLTASSTGIVLLGAAAIWFCLRQLHQAFLIAMLLVITLAVTNLVLLMLGRRAAEAQARYAAETREAFIAAAAAAARTAVMSALPAAAPGTTPPQTGPDLPRVKAAAK